MLVHPVRPFSDRAHCHISPVTPPSPSSRVAVSGVPVSGSAAESVTTPSSSTSTTKTDADLVASIVGAVSVLPAASLPSCSVR